MSMTKKDYELIAKVLKDQYKSSFTHVQTATAETEAYAVRMVAVQFAEELAKTNPQFDRKRFLEACGVVN